MNLFDEPWLGLLAQQPVQQQNPWLMPGWLFIMILIFYFLMIRPQQRREKERKAMLDTVKKGDRVMFSGGIVGIVSNVKKDTLFIKTGETRLEVTRGAISAILGKDQSPEEVDEKA